MFANRYISKNIIYPEFIRQEPDPDLGMIIVIPCYREPDVLETLQSLVACTRPTCGAEVIIVVNQPENETSENSEINRETFLLLKEWETQADRPWLHFFPISPDPFPPKTAGAGMSRKTGMDEAIRRFHAINRPDGIIVSLDADTIVDPAYLVEIEQFFKANTGYVGATIRFQHRIDPAMTDERQTEGIRLYERYLHYYRDALAYTGYPFAIFTIGSAFCCTAESYTKQGGMNRRQAGEDFYFLHKLSQLGPIGEINSTCVFPLARLSDRVPFGTGPILQRWLDGQEDLTYTYNFQAFSDLKVFFDQLDSLFKINEDAYHRLLAKLPLPLQQFLKEDHFFEELTVVNQHSSSVLTFRKRFFQVFNAFKILKFINFIHHSFYSKQKIYQAETKLLFQKKIIDQIDFEWYLMKFLVWFSMNQ